MITKFKLFERFIGTTKLNYNDDVYNVKIFQNPENLKLLPIWCRGIITKNGDLFIFYDDKNFISHSIGLFSCFENNLIPNPQDVYWEDEKPQDFVCVSRFENTGEFYLSESYYEDIIETYKNKFEDFIHKAREKSNEYNPSILFYIQNIDEKKKKYNDYQI